MLHGLHGENTQDAEMIPRVELLVTLSHGLEVTLSIPLISRNVVSRDNNTHEVNANNGNTEEDTIPETTPSAGIVSDSSDTITSESNSQNNTSEDPELQVHQRARRMMRKRKHSNTAVQHSDSTSEDEQHRVSLRATRRRIHRQPRPSCTQEPLEKVGFSALSRDMEKQQDRKGNLLTFKKINALNPERLYERLLTAGPRKRQRKESKNATRCRSAPEVCDDTLTAQLKNKRKTHSDPPGNEDVTSEHEESLHSGPLKKKRTNHGDPAEHKSEEDYCSENSKCLQKNKGKQGHPLNGEESHGPANKPLTRAEAKKRRADENNSTQQPGAEPTPRKRKRKS